MRWTAARPPAPLQACCRWLRLVRDCLESTETAVLDVPRQHELQERWVAVSRGAPAADAAPQRRALQLPHSRNSNYRPMLCCLHTVDSWCVGTFIWQAFFCHEIAYKLIGVWHLFFSFAFELFIEFFFYIWTRGASCLRAHIFQYFWLKFSRDQVSI